MPRSYGGRSKYLTRKEWGNAFFALSIVGVLMLGWLFFFYNISLFSSPLGSLLTLFVIVPIFYFGYKRVKYHFKVSNEYHKGQVGEDIIWNELAKLPDEYIRFRDIDLDRIGNIDSIVVGPTGLFVIEAKSESGFVSFNGEQLTKNGYPFERDYIKQVLGQVSALKKYLEIVTNIRVAVFPVIAFSGWARMTFWKKPQNGVFVVKKELLNDLIKNPPQRFELTPEDIDILSQKLKAICREKKLE